MVPPKMKNTTHHIFCGIMDHLLVVSDQSTSLKLALLFLQTCKYLWKKNLPTQCDSLLLPSAIAQFASSLLFIRRGILGSGAL